jgi:isopenicillin N synthase-like dioxygenase
MDVGMIDIPIIDLAASDSDDVAKAIDRALSTVGFMAVVGHDVDPQSTAAMFATMDEFFALPLQQKLAAAPADPANPRGYRCVGATAQANAHDVVSKPDLVETFSAGLDPVPDTEYHRRAAHFFQPNIWPATPPGLASVWSEYLASMQSLAERILASMGQALGIGSDYFADLVDKPMASITVNRYPALGLRPDEDQFRGGAHTDYGSITLLTTDGVPGLQLQDADGQWVNVQPVPGAFHVNTGDMLAHWSGGHWRSTWHRVALPAGPPPYPSRTSIAYFHNPNADVALRPLVASDTDTDTAEPVLAAAYLRSKLDRYYAVASPNDT